MDRPEYSTRLPESDPPSINREPVEKLGVSSAIPESDESPSEAPMIFEYFNVKGWPELLLTPKLDHNKVIDKVSRIEEFIKGRLAMEGLKPEKSSYDLIMKQLEDELNITGAHESHFRIDKVFALIKIIEKDHTAKERKKSIINLLNSKNVL